MKSMKKIFIGLAAIAAVGVSALFFAGNDSSELLSADVKALSQSELPYLCASNRGTECRYVFPDEVITIKNSVRDDITTEFLHFYDDEIDD